MIAIILWCSFAILIGNRASPTKPDVYAVGEGKYVEIQDSEAAGSDDYLDRREDLAEFGPDYERLDRSDDPPSPEDHVIPYSEHEEPRDVPTRPNYTAPGVWAKPDPKKNIPLKFTPTKSLAQVRGTHTVRILPRSASLAAADTDEEKLNAPRLREVVSKKKTNTIYTEEGYEDSAYDHGGHVRDADFHEGYARKLHDQVDDRGKSGSRGGGQEPRRRKSGRKLKKAPRAKIVESFDEFADDYRDEHSSEAEDSPKKKKKRKKTRRNKVKKSRKDPWLRVEVDPKVVAENEIEKLENDLQREEEEAERGSEINGVDSVETSSKQNRNKDEYASNEVEAPTTEQYYIPVDATRENHKAIDDDTTTLTYGDESWSSYQVNPTDATTHRNFMGGQTTVLQQQQLREATTFRPPGENPTPLTIATINGHGPYLLFSDYDESTRNPKHFDLSSSSIGLSTTASTFPYYAASRQDIPVEHKRHSVNPTFMPREFLFGGGRVSGFDDTTASHPDVGQSYDAWGLHQSNYPQQMNAMPATSFPTVGYLEGFAFSSTPTYSLLNLEKNVEDQRTGVGVRGRNEELGGETSKWDYIPGLEYNKMLEYIRGDRTRGSDSAKSESEVLEDFTIMKPPTLGRFSFTDLRPNSYPKVAGSSTVAQESSVSHAVEREKSKVNKNGFNHGTRIGKETMKLEAGSAHRTGLFPATNLLPPEPSQYEAQFYSNNPGNRYESAVNPNPMLASRRIGRIYDPELQRLPGIRNRRGCRRRCRRSVESGLDEARIADAVIAQEINARLNLTFGHRSSEPKSRVKRYLTDESIRSSVARDEVPFEKSHCQEETVESEDRDSCGSRSKVNHEELLNSSPRIAGEVIDSEIESRFEEQSGETEDGEKVDEEVDDHEDQTVDEDREDEGEREEEEEEEESKGSESLVDVEEPDLDYLDEIQDLNEIDDVPTTTVKSIDPRKYPFYRNDKIPNSSPLKYIVDPKTVPKKSFGGMEFYDSRDRYARCEDVDPDLEGIVEEEPEPDRGPKENLPRLRGLGDKLDCFKAKYFDENPFDSPIFLEKRILQPTPPAELDPVKFAERISSLPEEEDSYVIQAQSKRPEDGVARTVRKVRRPKVVDAETHSKTTPKSRTNRKPIPVTLSVAAKKPETTTTPRVRRRRPVRKMQLTTTEIIPTSVSTSPYQKAVYEDVMGTIRNLAGMYEVFGSGETSTVPKVTLSKEHRTTVGRGSRIKNAPHPEEIEGLLPPPKLAKKTSSREPENAASIIRPRIESPPKETIVGYLTTVRVQKRSLTADESSTPVPLRGRDVAVSTEKPKRGRRRHTDFTTVKTPTMDSGEKSYEVPKNTTYVNRSRSRKVSRKNEEHSRHGLFTTTPNPSTVTDVRRKEPRYNEISRRTTTTTTVSPNLVREEDVASQTDVVSSTESGSGGLRNNNTSSVVDLEPSGGIYRAVTSELKDREAEGGPAKNEGTLDLDENQGTGEKSRRRKRKYRVHENVDEVNTTPATIRGSGVEESDDPDPLTYLSEDSVGYEKTAIDFSPKKNNAEDDYSEGNVGRGENIEENDEIRESGERVSSDEDEAESGGSSEGYNESRSEEDSGERKKSDEKENAEEEKFFRFEDRPDSPSESFEDDQYAGLGPRVNKPAFVHPRFKVPMFERQRFGIGSDDDEDETEETSERDKYVFPWHREEDDGDKDSAISREYSPFTYEYPWEKRARLARERKKRMKERARLRKIMGYSDDEDDAEELERDDDRKAASSSNYKSHAYPWDSYDDKNYQSRFDSDEMSSEQLPVANINNKYTSVDFTLPMQVKKSVLNFLNKSSDSIEPTVAYETPYPIYTTTSAPPTTESTTIGAIVATTTTVTSRIESTQKTLARPSESRIIPENVTMSPKRRTRGRGVAGTRNNTTRVRSTGVKKESEKSPTTQRSTGRWRKMADRVARKSARKAQESQVSAVTELPSSEVTSTESQRAVDTSSVKQSRKLTLQRGKTRGTPRTTEASRVETIRDDRTSSETKTESATVTKRRRTRPSATIVTTSPKTWVKKTTKDTTRKLLKVTDKVSGEVTEPTASLEVTDASVEDATPTRRRVEHRSLVSSEEFITKTSYPDDDVVYKLYKDKTTTKKKIPGEDEVWPKTKAITSKPKKFSKVTKPSGGSLDETDERVRSEGQALKTSLLKNPEVGSGARDIVESDGKGTPNGFASKNRRAPSAMDDELHLKRAEMHRHDRKNGRFENDPTNGNKEDTTNILATDIILLNNLLQRSPPRANRSGTTNRLTGKELDTFDFIDESDDFYLENEYESDNEGEASQPNIEIDPSRRLYHYVEDE